MVRSKGATRLRDEGKVTGVAEKRDAKWGLVGGERQGTDRGGE